MERPPGTIEALYEQVRALVAVQADGAPSVLHPVAPGIRVLALRTPTLPPAAHTNVYLVGPEAGPVAVVDPGSPYLDQQRALDAVLEELARRLAGIVDVTRLVEDGEVIHGATAVFTPGHAEGHLCFEVGAAPIAGDMVAGIGSILIDPDEGDMALYLASLERLLARPPATLLPAHGPPIVDGPGKLAEYLRHRRMRETRVVDALASESTLPGLIASVYADTPRELWPLAERSLLAHLDKLVREDRARNVGGRWSR
ncbi:MAG: gloB [Deltaproteobacteria bacterium]|nr:gloB [Deltaproteobacteria bacterium]